MFDTDRLINKDFALCWCLEILVFVLMVSILK